jgi:hypothetical protein
MQFVTDMGWRPALVINPPVKGIFKQAPDQKSRTIADAQAENAGVQDGCFPVYEKHDGYWIADKTDPVIDIVSRKAN